MGQRPLAPEQHVERTIATATATAEAHERGARSAGSERATRPGSEIAVMPRARLAGDRRQDLGPVDDADQLGRPRRPRIGLSVSAAAWSAARMIVVGRELGSVELVVGRGRSRMTQRSVRTCGVRDVAHEVGHVVVGRRTDEVLGPAGLDDRAVAHDHDPVARA